MVDKIINNFNREFTDTQQLYPQDPATNAGLGSQFVLYSSAVVAKVKVKMVKYSGGTPPTGDITARIYSSHTDLFRDVNDYADTLIAESTDSLDVDDLSTSPTEVEFTFNNVALSPGVYFISFFSSNLVRNDGSISLLTTDNSSSAIGFMTFWFESLGRWGSWWEWD